MPERARRQPLHLVVRGLRHRDDGPKALLLDHAVQDHPVRAQAVQRVRGGFLDLALRGAGRVAQQPEPSLDRDLEAQRGVAAQGGEDGQAGFQDASRLHGADGEDEVEAAVEDHLQGRRVLQHEMR